MHLSVVTLSLLFASSVLARNARAPSHHHIAKSSVSVNTDLSDDLLQKVTNNAITISTHSWEIGTLETALFEVYAPHAFLYKGAIPPKISPGDNVTQIWASVDRVMAQKPADIEPFFRDGAAGDPASVGIPVLIRHATQTLPTTNWSIAAAEQLDYEVNVVPRTPDGAISHRQPSEAVQLWADNLSMSPPFIGYYGALYQNKSLVDLAYNQIRLYRQYLLDNSSLWEHIVLGQTNDRDYDHWSTGNGWALNGAIRVLRAIQLSPFAEQMRQEQENLIQWSMDLTSAIWSHQQDDGSLPNYLDMAPNSTFHESSGTALTAASTFRLATILGSRSPSWCKVNVRAALIAKQYIISQVDSDGFLQGVVNPLNWRQAAPAGVHSPEGQSFVLMMHAAARDWREATGGIY